MTSYERFAAARLKAEQEHREMIALDKELTTLESQIRAKGGRPPERADLDRILPTNAGRLAAMRDEAKAMREIAAKPAPVPEAAEPVEPGRP